MTLGSLAQLSNDEILSQLTSIRMEGNRLLTRLIAVLIEVEDRRLYLELACSSMFDFCTRKLGMSEGEAFRRLTAARLVRRFPELLGRLERGELHLSALQLLANHLTAQNVDALAVAASHKTKKQVEELIARIAPSPDVPPRMRALPAAGPPPRVAPLSTTRHEVRFTASSAQREKLERARDLMRHANPSGDLAVVVERALDLLIAKLEKERLGKATRARSRASAPKAGRIPRAVRREVFSRDGDQCTYLSDSGDRCPARALLELDHIEPRALDGREDPANLRVRCRPHNRLHAEEVFGKERVARAIHLRQRKLRPSATEGDSFESAARGLTTMGFRATQVQRAIAAVRARRPLGAARVPVQDVLREALAVLG